MYEILSRADRFETIQKLRQISTTRVESFKSELFLNYSHSNEGSFVGFHIRESKRTITNLPRSIDLARSRTSRVKRSR